MKAEKRDLREAERARSVFMARDAGWWVGGMRVSGNFLRSAWEELSGRAQVRNGNGKVMVRELGSEGFANKSFVR